MSHTTGTTPPLPSGPACVVVIGGDPPPAAVAGRLPSGATVIAADSGADHAIALGLHVDLLVGDLDSVSDEAVAAIEARGGSVDRHPVDKDATDTELAIDAAWRAGHRAITVVSGGGGRLDHLLASVTVLARSDLPLDVALDAWIGTAHVDVLRGPADVTLRGTPGELVSLVPLGASADGVVTTGLRWPLHGERLTLGTSRGTSNEMVAPEASVHISGGMLLVVRPLALGSPTSSSRPSAISPALPGDPR